MERLDNRLITILLAMILGLIILLFVCFLTLFLQPNLPFNPLSPNRATAIAATQAALIPTVTATSIPAPTYPATWTPSPTFTPAPTKTSTETRTQTPTRTATASPSPTPTDTATQVVLPTSTPIPPYVYVGLSGPETTNNCANIKLQYSVFGGDGEPLAGFQIEYGEIGARNSVFITERTEYHENYGVTLIPGSDVGAATRSYNWFAHLIENGQKVSKSVLFSTDPIFADEDERCGESDDEEDDEGCILNPCESEDAINVKHIVWRPQVSEFVPIATPTPRPGLCTRPYDDFIIPRTCSDCATQADAQRLYQAVGGPRVDIYDLDRNRNGIACDEPRTARLGLRIPPTSTPTTAP